ncbi:MAG: putative hydrolase [Verrucomicrobiales bacterium]|nr:putative hydrolase [Verrucomicrobiales bacterium]
MNKVALTLEYHGCRLAYTVTGSGTPVLFIQGTGVHGNGWMPQVEALAAQYNCISFDNRGMGGSQPIGCSITVEQMADDVIALMDAQGWDSAHIVGHSLGGLIALQLAIANRARVRSLSLLCTFAKGSLVTQFSWPMFWRGLRTYIGTRRMRRRAFLEMVMPHEMLASTDSEKLAASLAPLFGHDLADHPPVVMKQLAALRRYDATSKLSTLAGLPTLVVSATQDCVAKREFGQAIAAGIPGSRYVEIPKAAHGVTIQCADRINSLLRDHFSSVESKRSVRETSNCPSSH